MSTLSGAMHGGRTGAQLGAIGGPLGAAAGALAGAIIGGAAGWWLGNQIANQMKKADEKADEELDNETSSEQCVGSCGGTKTPDDPDELSEEGWEETTHPKEAEAGRRRFRNPETGDELVFDKGREGASGWRGRDHWHRPNPNSTNRHDRYLDRSGNPVRDGSGPSHIPPGTPLGRGGTS